MRDDNYKYMNDNETDSTSDALFQWLPMCGITVDLKGNILEMNDEAKKFFGVSTESRPTDFLHIHSVFVETSQANDFQLELKQSRELIVTKLLFRKTDRKIAFVDVYARLISNPAKVFVLLFSESRQSNHFIFSEMIQSFWHEVMQLRPYLNKPGKELLQKIVSESRLDEVIKNSPVKKTPAEIVTNKRIAAIAFLFPELTNNELVFCGLLSMRLTMDEIAHITGKTPNNLRVSFHRILRKSNLKNGKELLRKFEAIEV
jgi:hypothetical protein